MSKIRFVSMITIFLILLPVVILGFIISIFKASFLIGYAAAEQLMAKLFEGLV